jgi:hypothetical protein
MTLIDEAPLDAGKLEQFVFRAVDEVGATLNAALVVMGDRLGLYRALAGAGALTPAELAARTGTAERYVREWLNAQAAGGYVDYHPAEGAYSLAPEQAVAFCDEDSPAYLPGLFQTALGSVLDSPRITDAARSGAGEPAAGDRVEDNLNPIGRAYYGLSTMLCTPASLSQDVGLALGAQAGEARLREVVTAAGFTRFRRAAETPFNLVLEARP